MISKDTLLNYLQDLSAEIKTQIEDVLSVAMIGSAAEELILKNFLTAANDIDIVILLERNFCFDETIIDISSINLPDKLKKFNNKSVAFTYNGLRTTTIILPNSLTIDIVPHSKHHLHDNDALTIIDIAHRYYIPVFGPDYYKIFTKVPVTPKICIKRISEINNYIRREYYKDNVPESVRNHYLAKSAILISSFLIIDNNPTLNKLDIVNTICQLHPKISEQLQLAYKYYKANKHSEPAVLDIHKEVTDYVIRNLTKRCSCRDKLGTLKKGS